MGLFQHSVLNKYLKEANQTEMKAAYQKLTDYFHNPVIQQNMDHFKKLWRSRVDFQIRDSSFPIIKMLSILIDIFSCRRPSSFSSCPSGQAGKKRRSSPEHSGQGSF